MVRICRRRAEVREGIRIRRARALGERDGLSRIEGRTHRHTATAAQLYVGIHPLNTKSIALFEKFGAEIVERKLAFKEL